MESIILSEAPVKPKLAIEKSKKPSMHGLRISYKS